MTRTSRGGSGFHNLKLTKCNPLSQIAHPILGALGEASVQFFTKVSDDLVHERLQRCQAALGIVLGNGALHPGMLGVVRLAKQMVGGLAIDDGAVVVVELGLFEKRKRCRVSQLLFLGPVCTDSARDGPTYLAPLAVRAVQGFDQLGVVQVQQVRSYPNHGTIFVMKLLHPEMVVPRPHEKETP